MLRLTRILLISLCVLTSTASNAGVGIGSFLGCLGGLGYGKFRTPAIAEGTVLNQEQRRARAQKFVSNALRGGAIGGVAGRLTSRIRWHDQSYAEQALALASYAYVIHQGYRLAKYLWNRYHTDAMVADVNEGKNFLGNCVASLTDKISDGCDRLSDWYNKETAKE